MPNYCIDLISIPHSVNITEHVECKNLDGEENNKKY